MLKMIYISAAMLLLSSCLKKQHYPIRPNITFLGIVMNTSPASPTDSIGTVRFSFTDGDGDLGLRSQDTTGDFALGQPYYYNLFIHYYEKQNGQYVEFVPAFPFHVRFKSLTPDGADKTLEGEMNVGVFAQIGTPFDTVRYEMYIVDRELHHSDTIVTPDVILSF